MIIRGSICHRRYTMNISSLGSMGLQFLGRNQSSLTKLMSQISTGKSINRASDNPAGMAMATLLHSQVRGLNMASNNVSDAVNALNVADGASGQVSDLLARQRELAVQSGNGTLTDSDRSALNEEYQQLSQEINRITEGTEFNGQNVLDGTELASGSTNIQAGEGSGTNVALPGVNLTTSSLGTSGTSIGSISSAGSALEALDTAITRVNEQRSAIGAAVNRFGHTNNVLATSAENSTQSNSTIEDLDMALGVAKFSQAKMLNEFGMKSFSMFKQISSQNMISLMG